MNARVIDTYDGFGLSGLSINSSPGNGVESLSKSPEAAQRSSRSDESTHRVDIRNSGIGAIGEALKLGLSSGELPPEIAATVKRYLEAVGKLC